MRLKRQLGSSLRLTSGRDRKGYILRDGEETPAEIPRHKSLPGLAVCVFVVLQGSLEGENVPSPRKLGNLPQNTLDIWGQDRAWPWGIWNGSLAMAHPMSSTVVQGKPNPGQRCKSHQADGRPHCSVG